jgi:predicted DNA-binding transcriptional regulator YafY
MRYESWTSVREREVDPLGLVLKAGVWYLVARQGRELRTFKLAAIQTLERLTEPFVRPRRFDLVAYWAEATRRFEESVYRGVATLRVSPAGLARLRRFGPLVADAADRASGAADARGWRRVTVPIESVEHAADEMLRLGAEAEVIEPEALREALRLKAERLLALYAA